MLYRDLCCYSIGIMLVICDNKGKQLGIQAMNNDVIYKEYHFLEEVFILRLFCSNFKMWSCFVG